MKLSGKYTVIKNSEKIQQPNKLTIFGALQIAKLLKRDVVFPKFNNSPFGYIKSYGGQYKKISIVDGSTVDYANSSQFAQFGGTNYKPTYISNQYSPAYMIDDDYSTYVKMTYSINTSNSQTYFDINLTQPLNIGKIGIAAKIDGFSNNGSYDNYDSYERFSKMSDFTVYFRPQGVHITIHEGNTSTVLKDTEGDYIRVYNTIMPTINEKPYYIMNKMVQQQTQEGTSGYKRVFYCLYYNNEYKQWAVKDVTTLIETSINQNATDNHKTIDKYIFSSTSLNSTDCLYTFAVPTVTQKINSVIQLNHLHSTISNVVSTASIFLNDKKINKWIRPVYRLHNYFNNFYGQGTAVQTQQKRNMQMISDIGCHITNKSGNTKQQGIYIKYSSNDSGFNQYLSYSCFSFQSIAVGEKSIVDTLYNYNNQVFTTDLQCVKQHLVGFVPYVDGIRFCRTNSSRYEQYLVGNPTIIYAIDLFVKTPTPYSPIKIGLSQSGNFDQTNSWYVDKIEKIGTNKVVFSKTLTPSQGKTYGEGYKYIGLFGNFEGHLNGTIPADISIKNSNCFSKAEFVNAWQKDDSQSIQLQYQITIGDE